MPILADFGTSWTKIYNTKDQSYKLLPTKEVDNLIADVGTGHNVAGRSKKYVNELTAMALGAKRMIRESTFKVLDIGSRDMKYISFKDGNLEEMDWNATCGAFTGFTIELLGRYYNIDFNAIKPSKEALPITCGVIGMERLFDMIANGISIEEAIASFVRGVACFAHNFIHRPRKFYLSGGMCDNPLFLVSFPDGIEVIPLGRFLLVEGLKSELNIY